MVWPVWVASHVVFAHQDAVGFALLVFIVSATYVSMHAYRTDDLHVSSHRVCIVEINSCRREYDQH